MRASLAAGTVLYPDQLFESECHLPQVVGHMVGSTQQYCQSVPSRRGASPTPKSIA